MEKLFERNITNYQKYQDKAISDKVKDCMQIHIYLIDLREERPQLVFENGTIYQITSYDIYLLYYY